MPRRRGLASRSLRLAVCSWLCSMVLATPACAGATFSPASEILHLPAVVVWGLGAFDVRLALADPATLEFVVAGATPTVSDDEQAATFRFNTMTLHVPVVTVLFDAGPQHFTVDLQVVPDTSPSRLRVASARALPAARFAALTPATFSTLPPTETLPTVVDPARQFYLPYSSPRRYGYGNVFGNGLNDLVAAPSFRETGPELPIEIWKNTGDGHFENRTSEVLADVVTTQLASNVFVADLNGDGFADVFIVDQGFEVPGQPFTGSRNKLLLSGPDSKLHDVSATLPVSYAALNHRSAMADLDGDGCPDFVITELGTGPVARHSGVYLLLNDCAGRFTKVTATLPIEIVEKDLGRGDNFVVPADYQNVYHAGAADLNGDGIVDLITGSGPGGDVTTRERTLRVFDGARGFAQVARLTLPASLAAVPGLGLVDFAFADLDGDGRLDVIAAAERDVGGPTYVVVYRNLGNFSFRDVTAQVLGGYDLSFVDARGGFHLINSLGRPLRLEPGAAPALRLGCFGLELSVLAEGRCLLVNEGGTRLAPWGFTKDGRAATAQDVQQAAPMPSFACGFAFGLPLVFDANGDGVADVVLVADGCTTPEAPHRTSALQIVVFLSAAAAP